MSLPSSPKFSWSKRDLSIITKYKERIKDIQQQNLQKKLISKDVNSIDFYSIASKEELPKFLQKMQFQTLHSKQNQARDVKVFKKQVQSADEINIRKKLKKEGNIMFLSEIYQSLGQSLQSSKSHPNLPKFLQNYGGDLQQWQKSKNNILQDKLMIMKRHCQRQQFSPRNKQSRIIEQKLSELHRTNTGGGVVNYFKQGSNYKKQIEKQLQIIYYTHSSEPNQVNRYILIQNSSRLLKKQLDEKKSQVEDQMNSKIKILNDTRIEHHQMFQQKTDLLTEQKQCDQQISMKEHYSMTSSMTFFGNNTSNKLMQIKTQKRQQIEQLESKINKNKKLIDSLQNSIQNCEEQLNSIAMGEMNYYIISLKFGLDCRDTGLGWILRKLRDLMNKKDKQSLAYTNNKEQQHEFPLYLDKKSKQFLIVKTRLEEQLQQLLEQKRKFVSQIGRSTASSSNNNLTDNFRRRVSIRRASGCWASLDMKDKIIEEEDHTNDTSDIPKKYKRSLKKINLLNQQYAQNHSLLQLKPRHTSSSKGLNLSINTDGLTGKKLYQTITEKIKFFDFSKAKKDKSLLFKNNKLLEYQNLLKSIKQIHIKLEDLDIQHQNHLTTHYKQKKDVFFQQCAACFGYKKSYSMIIKYFSWKSPTHQLGSS